jgi:hypothetical protein
MGRPSHVHDKELVEEVEERRENARRRKGCGCLSCLTGLGFFVILAGVAALFFFGWGKNHIPASLRPALSALASSPSRPLQPAVPSATGTPSADWKARTSEWLDALREKTAGIQKNLDDLQKDGKVADQLQALRDTLSQKQDTVAKYGRQEMQNLTQTLDTMISEAKKKGETLRSVDFDKLKSQMDTLVKLLPQKSESDKAATPTPVSASTPVSGN